MERPGTARLRLPETTTRLVVLGDPHGDLIGLDEVLRRESSPETAFVSVGDNVGYGDGVASSHLCAALEARQIPSVVGNHEAWSEDGHLPIVEGGPARTLTPEALAWCRALPQRIELELPALPKARAIVVHTLPGWAYVKVDNAERLLDVEDATVVFCGHSHRPAIYTVPRAGKPSARRLDPRTAKPVQVRYDPGKRYVVDAGSLARPAGPRGGPRFERASYAVFDLRAGQLELRALDKTPRIQELLRAFEAQAASAQERPGHHDHDREQGDHGHAQADPQD